MSYTSDNSNPDAPAPPEVPSIQVTAQDSTHDLTSYSATHVAPESPFTSSSNHPNSHSRSPSDPSFLSPILRQPALSPGANSVPSVKTSLDVPRILGSPTISVDDTEGSSQCPPPSPTLSTQSSVHFANQTSLALRDNKPEETTGLSSLGLLAPSSHAHSRRSSNASTIGDPRASSEETDPDSHTLGLAPPSSPGTSSYAPSPTTTQFEGSDAGTTLRERSPSRFRRPKADFTDSQKPPIHRRDTGESDEEEEVHIEHIDLEADNDIDAGPFLLKPNQLAYLVDPKNFPALRELGGVKGVLKGLGTNAKTGLSARALTQDEPHPVDADEKATRDDEKSSVRDGRPGGGGELGAGDGASQRHDRLPSPPAIVVTGPGGDNRPSDDQTIQEENDDDETGGHDNDPKSQLVYDANITLRHRVFGENVLPTRKTKSLLALMWLALKDKVLVLLSIAAVVSLALGFFQDFGTPRANDEPPVDWVEGVAIVVAIFIVVMVGSLNDWQKERQFQKLNEKKDERGVKVIRNGVETVVDIKQVVVGDIALLEPGEIVPCDGIFLGGHNVRCDESAITGESDAIRKIPYSECSQAWKRWQPKDSVSTQKEGAGGGDYSVDEKKPVEPSAKAQAMGAHDGPEELKHTDCFIVSGSKVLEGYGSYVVIAVGTKSFNGRIMMALRGDAENTPLQLKLNNLAELIAKLGSAAGLLLFTALMIRFFVQLGTNDPARTSNEKGIAFVQILIISVTLVVVAVPEGLPLAVTLALAFATKRMTKENLLVRVLGSCETMANASVVCTDKTGTLTQNEMTVVAGSIGIHCKFVHKLDDNKARTNAGNAPESEKKEIDLEAGEGPKTPTSPIPPRTAGKNNLDFSVDQSELNRVLGPSLCDLFNKAICINSTAFEDADPETKELVFVGSKTETALLKFAKENGWANYKETRDAAEIVQMIPFSSERKAMGVVVKTDRGYRLYLKGASEIMTNLCSKYVVVRQDGPGSGNAIDEQRLDAASEENNKRTIMFYANQCLRTIALCYRDFESWPPAGVYAEVKDEVPYEFIAKDMTLIGITGIEDPLREGVRQAVQDCQRAGVAVKMCTGDNIITAKSIATQCGIYSRGGIIMEGPKFRELDEEKMLQTVPYLQVLARSSPEDKKLLVESLRKLGEIVGVTGDGTNDGPALKTADVGFSMGIAGTEVAKEASDIILMDDNFASIVKAIMWGRCVNDAVRKFLQFQISTNITAVIITFVSAVASAEEQAVLSAVQLLWINIIMDTFAALALATDPASVSLLDRKPDKKTSPLFSVDMYKQIFGQSTYQTIITLVFHFLGSKILGFHSDPDPKVEEHHAAVVQTLVFNLFVFAQIFNSVNCRRLDNKLNIFEGITRNWYFLGITLIEVGVQVLIVFVGGAAFQVTEIGGREWGISLALGFVSIPLGALIRFIPNAPVEKFFKKIRLLRDPDLLPQTRPDGEWNSAINMVRDNLYLFSHVRGARLRGSSYVGKSRKASPKKGGVALTSVMAMVPSLIASSVGAGWSPQSPSGLSDPARFDPSKSSAALWEGKVQIHPDTQPDDPVFKLFSPAASKNV